MVLAAGSRLGSYEIVSPLGAGGMGEVYRAHDARLDRDVAIKILSPGASEDSTSRPRLLREARSAAALNHPNVCTIYEVGEADGQAYIAMEAIEGRPLDLLVAGGSLPVERVLDYGIQIADAVAHAHERGIVHRDLKPSNALVTPEGRVKVLDFGLARRVLHEDLAEATTASHATLTQAGALVGTLPYMSPEQLRGEPADARGDVWSLGVMLHEMASGARPFRGQTGFEVSSAILKERPAPLPETVPDELRSVLERCLEKEPGRRFQRAGEVLAALKVVEAGGTALRAEERHGLGRAGWLSVAGALLAAVAILAVLDVGGLRQGFLRGLGGPARSIKLAVLPFANVSGDPEQEYFSDGLTEEMIAQLGRLHPQRLGVIARTSAMRYKKSDKPIDQIGRELGVDYVLEGSARREAGRVRITAELIAVRDQTQLWAESYERELSGILALQSNVAQKVAGALALKLLPAERDRLGAARPVNPEAYEAYLKGLHRWYDMAPRDLDAAQQYFELALEKDPKYALAYAGIALVWATRSQMSLTPSEEAGPKAGAAARKAVELDDTLAEAHFALAANKAWYEWDWAGSEREFQRAIELNPSHPDTRAFYSHYLDIMRRPDEAMTQIQRALELDPFNALFQGIYAGVLFDARRYDDAIAQARKALRTSPDQPVAHAMLWACSFKKRMPAEALAEAKWFFPQPEIRDAFDRGWAEGGYAGAMTRAAQAQVIRSRTTFVNPIDIATLYAHGGQVDAALEWLEKAYAVHEQNLPYLGAPDFDGLRSDPRFQDLLRRMGLPPAPPIGSAAQPVTTGRNSNGT